MKQIYFGVLALVMSFQHPAFAAGGGGDSTFPPKQTQTTQDCFSERQWDPEIKRYVRYAEKVNGVWDPQLRRCIRPDKAGYLQSELLEDAVRELAYSGRLDEAQLLLSQMDASSDFVLTYWGFTHRKLGDQLSADRFYAAALKKNPDNLLTRSYMGQGLVVQGDYIGARDQLLEIRARGGKGTWAELALLDAIETGTGYDY